MIMNPARFVDWFTTFLGDYIYAFLEASYVANLNPRSSKGLVCWCPPLKANLQVNVDALVLKDSDVCGLV